MKKETRKNVFLIDGIRMRLSSVTCVMRRCVYVLMILCIPMNLLAHDHPDGEGHLCSHSEHSHAECFHPQQSNGDITSVQKCTACSGSGRCLMCMGSGMIYSVMGMTYCPGCMGTGKCLMCHGAGVNVYSGNVNSNVGTINGQMVVVPMNGNNNHGSSSGHSNSTRICNVCNGTGLKISERWMGSITSQEKWCNICGKFVLFTHKHVRCNYCKGTGKLDY